MLLEGGKPAYTGTCSDCVNTYESISTSHGESEWIRLENRLSRPLTFESASCRVLGRQPRLQLQIDLTLQSNQAHAPAFLAVDILESGGSSLMQAVPRLDPFITQRNEPHLLKVTIELPPLIPGGYGVSFWTGPHNSETFDEVRNCASFDVLESPTAGRTFPHHRNHGMLVPLSEVQYCLCRNGAANAQI